MLDKLTFITGPIFELLLGLMSMGVIAVLGFVARWVKSKIDYVENENYAQMLYLAKNEVYEASKEAVKIVEEKMVKAYKEEGIWNSDAKELAKEMALTKLRIMVSDRSLNFLESVWGWFEDWAGEMIDGQVIESKKNCQISQSRLKPK